MQPDPASRGGVPDYVYANDDPLDMSDPSGQAGVPSGCQSASYVSQGLNGALCEQRALHAGQQRAQAAFLAALNPLNAVFNPHASLGDRAFGVLALVPFVGLGGRALGLGADLVRGLSGTRDVETAISAVEGTAETASAATTGADRTISLFKAPRSGLGQTQFEEGFNPEDFPGSAYFARDKELAGDYASRGHYGEGVIEVRIPEDVYYGKAEGVAGFSQYVYGEVYDGVIRNGEVLDGVTFQELRIPAERLGDLNQFPRVCEPQYEYHLFEG